MPDRGPEGARIDAAAVLATAERLVKVGIPVFPCVPGEKRPLTQHGMLDATTDLEQIRAWWGRVPDANLAVPTGSTIPGRMTMDVLDVDVHSTGTGYPGFNALKRAGLLAGYERVVATPSGGMHVYFRPSDQPSSRLPARHLDFKAVGGYVLVPPSVVGAGRYVVVRRAAGLHQQLDWAAVRNHLAPAPTPASSSAPRRAPRVDVLAAWVATLPQGQRNTGTFWAACRAVEQGARDLTPIVEAALRTGLPELEARRTVASALRRAAAGAPMQSRGRGPM